MANEELDELATMDDEGGFFEQGSGPKGTYFQIFDGAIVMKSNEVVEGFETFTYWSNKKKQDVVVYLKRYEEIVARVVNVEKRKVKFDDGTKFVNYNITLIAGGKKAILQTTYMDAFLRKFLKVAPNLDFSKLIRFSAFKKQVGDKKKQLISIKQGTGKPYKEWPAVPFYWEHEKHPNGEANLDTPAVGADGSILPRPIHDEDSDEWDYRGQNKFLVQHFNENTLPKIHEIAESLGLNTKQYDEVSVDVATGSEILHTGPAIPVITSKPEEPASSGIADAMTAAQAIELRTLCKQVGADPDKLSNKFLETDFDDLSIEGAAYMKYRIEKKIKKAREEDPNAYPEPKADESKLRAELQSRKEAKAADPDDDDDDDDDNWDTPPAKATKAKADATDDDDDEDEDDWGK